MNLSDLRGSFILFAALLCVGCTVDPPVTTGVQLQFDGDGRRVRIISTTNLKRDWEAGATQPRLAAIRDAILAGRDEWANRFAAIEAESERLTVWKEFGDLRQVERLAVADREQLHRFFGDSPLALQVTPGDSWSELSIWTGTALRATREQRSNVDRMLALWSVDGARYVQAVGKLYEYLEQRPDRAQPLFAILFAGDDRPPDDPKEEALLQEVRASIAQIVDRSDLARDNAFSIDEEFDLVFNPFPASITVQTPGAILASENFKHAGDDSVEIPRAGITDALQALDGRWVSPDPLSILYRSSLDDSQPPNAETIALMKRKWTTSIAPADVQQAIVKALQRPSVYRVRWTETRPVSQ